MASALLDVLHQFYQTKCPPGQQASDLYAGDCKLSLILDLISDSRFQYIATHPIYICIFSSVLSFLR